nr:hypothetical protein B456_011G076700 [Ipomoea batatas]
MGLSPRKIELISCELIAHVSDIKLIRTDTTLDLSQKAEKDSHAFYIVNVGHCNLSKCDYGDQRTFLQRNKKIPIKAHSSPDITYLDEELSDYGDQRAFPQRNEKVTADLTPANADASY